MLPNTRREARVRWPIPTGFLIPFVPISHLFAGKRQDVGDDILGEEAVGVLAVGVVVVDVGASHTELVAGDGHGGDRLCHVGVEAEEQLSLLGVPSNLIPT